MVWFHQTIQTEGCIEGLWWSQISCAHTKNYLVSIHKELIIVRSSKLCSFCLLPSHKQRCLRSLPGHVGGNPPVRSSLGVMCMRVHTVLDMSSVKNKSLENCFSTMSSAGAKLTFSQVEASLCDLLCTFASNVSLIKSSHQPDWSGCLMRMRMFRSLSSSWNWGWVSSCSPRCWKEPVPKVFYFPIISFNLGDFTPWYV